MKAVGVIMNTVTMVRLYVFFIGFGFCHAILHSNEPYKQHIAIIGAGISGLTCANELRKAGFSNVDIYEARGRKGGRILTATINGKITELGGYNIRDGASAPHMHALIDELGLTITSYFKKRDAQFKCTKYFDGTDIIFTKSRLKKCNFNLETLDAQLTELAQQHQSIKEVLKVLFPNDPILYAVFAAKVEDYEGAAVEKLSSHSIDTLGYHLRGALSSAYGKEDDEIVPTEYVEGGNALIIERLAEKLEGKVHLNMPLEKISKIAVTTESGDISQVYELTFTTGETRTADIVILTIPCPVYKDISFDEDILSYERIHAIAQVLYGTNSKIMLPVISAKKGASSSYTNGRATLRLDDQNHVTIYYIRDNGVFSPETIESHFRKDRSFIENSYNLDPELPQPVCAQDKQFINYDGPVGHSWAKDPYIKGSYSCIGVDQEEAYLATEDYAGEQVKSLFAPIDDTLFFAGEHTSTKFDVDGLDVSGTMEAAAESGFRTARIINNMYGIK